jgi:hypothetical protein
MLAFEVATTAQADIDVTSVDMHSRPIPNRAKLRTAVA